MSKFARTRTTDDPEQEQPANRDLPAGYDDPDSEFFTPEALRPFYRVRTREEAENLAEQHVTSWVAYRRGAAEYDRRAKAAQPAEPPAGRGRPPAGTDRGPSYDLTLSDYEKARYLAALHGPTAYRPVVAMSEVTEDEVQIYLHQVRLGRAAKELNQLQFTADLAAQRAADETCTWCGDRDPEKVRQLPPNFLPGQTVLVCVACLADARTQVTERLAAELLVHGVRADLVTTALDRYAAEGANLPQLLEPATKVTPAAARMLRVAGMVRQTPRR